MFIGTPLTPRGTSDRRWIFMPFDIYARWILFYGLDSTVHFQATNVFRGKMISSIFLRSRTSTRIERIEIFFSFFYIILKPGTEPTNV